MSDELIRTKEGRLFRTLGVDVRRVTAAAFIYKQVRVVYGIHHLVTAEGLVIGVGRQMGGNYTHQLVLSNGDVSDLTILSLATIDSIEELPT